VALAAPRAPPSRLYAWGLTQLQRQHEADALSHWRVRFLARRGGGKPTEQSGEDHHASNGAATSPQTNLPSTPPPPNALQGEGTPTLKETQKVEFAITQGPQSLEGRDLLMATGKLVPVRRPPRHSRGGTPFPSLKTARLWNLTSAGRGEAVLMPRFTLSDWTTSILPVLTVVPDG